MKFETQTHENKKFHYLKFETQTHESTKNFEQFQIKILAKYCVFLPTNGYILMIFDSFYS